MFCDLNFPVTNNSFSAPHASKKGKGKQSQQFTPSQLADIEARIDLMVHLGYTVIAFNQTIAKKVDPKVHVNILDGLLTQLRKRQDVVFLKRLTIVLDEDSEKGFGLTNTNTSFFNTYDILSLAPTTLTCFSAACLNHTSPTPLTAHIISLPLTLPRLPYRMKHTLIRTAIKNGAVFEINYSGALGGESDPEMVEAGAALNGENAKKNWWGAAREVVRVTKGKSVLVSGGVVVNADLRGPKDIANIITLLGVPQDVAHACSTKVPKSLILRAQTRKTYRAVFSDPVLVVPEGYQPPAPAPSNETLPTSPPSVNKRARDEENAPAAFSQSQNPNEAQGSKKKKRKKNNQT